MTAENSKTAILYRMVQPKHLCPFGLKAKSLLRRKGYNVEDRHLKSREEIEAFKAKHGVTTTPQIFIDDQRVGGFEDLKRFLGFTIPPANQKTYRPIIALFAVAAALSVATTWLVQGQLLTTATLGWFISGAMILLGLQKLKDLDGFATMFLNYDLFAQRWVPYGYVYPFVETLAGLLMFAGVLVYLAAPAAFVIASIGAISVIKAVYIDQRELRCACVGGNTNVPLGFVSLIENCMMLGMAAWMIWRLLA